MVQRKLDQSRLGEKEQHSGKALRHAEVMRRVLLSLEGKINDRGLDVDVRIPDDPVYVSGDADSILQVGYNLLDNAIKFSPPKGTIGVEIRVQGNRAFVSVRNQGPEIPPEELPLIFDRFHKADRSRSMDREGVGLGLYILKTIYGPAQGDNRSNQRKRQDGIHLQPHACG
jgi:signal transduction histidine kinase